MFIKNFIFLLIITIIQIYLTSSTEEKCYSIKNCEICSELDTCDKCLEGFKINKSKTKCKSIGKKEKKSKKSKKEKPKKEETKTIKKETQPAPAPSPAPAPAQPAKPSPSPVNNPFLQKADISVNKAPNNPFQNIPTPSFQRFKDKEANNALINKILIFILIVLVLSIIVSVINNLLKKKNGNKSYSDDEGMDETSKVVSIH